MAIPRTKPFRVSTLLADAPVNIVIIHALSLPLPLTHKWKTLHGAGQVGMEDILLASRPSERKHNSS